MPDESTSSPAASSSASAEPADSISMSGDTEPTALPLELKDRGGAAREEGGEVEGGAPQPDASTAMGVASADGEDKQEGKTKGKEKEKAFTCHICLDMAEEPIVTPCGHLFCWPCLHEWLVPASGRSCPVCKSTCSIDRLIPIYSSGETTDPRSKPLPPRPRPNPTPSSIRGAVPSPSSFFGYPTPASTASSSAFSFQAGIFPLPGLSMSWSWPPIPTERGANNPHAAGTRGGQAISPEQEWARDLFQKCFLVLFISIFVTMTLAG